jgi:hypothetical protein
MQLCDPAGCCPVMPGFGSFLAPAMKVATMKVA